MPTRMSTIIARAREKLQEETARFWTDAELLHDGNAGIKDLWRSINMTKQDYWLKVDENSMTLVADTMTVQGVPSDFTTLKGIEPSDPDCNLKFEYRDFNHDDFILARASDSLDTDDTDTIFVAVVNRGSPISAPTIYIAPTVSDTLALRVSYIPSQPDVALVDDNPIPGESDKAIECWIIAYAMAKISESKAPNAEWLALYATEKSNIVEFLIPRHKMQPLSVEPFFKREWGG